MEIRVTRSEFLGELGPMQGIVERKTTIPVLSHLLLTARGDKLHLAATDLDVSLDLLVRGRRQARGGHRRPGQEAGGDHPLAHRRRGAAGPGGAARAHHPGRQVALQDPRPGAGRLPDPPTVEDGRRVDIPFTEFRRMVAKILFAVSAEESRFQLNGALLKLKDGSLEMVATDGHRLALVEGAWRAPAARTPSWCRARPSRRLQRFEGDGKLSYGRGEHHLSFGLGRRELICRILEGTFPDYERVIAKDNDKKVLFDRKQLVDAVQRAALMTGDRARAVRLQFAPDQVVISAVNSDLGEAVEEVACDYDGPEFRVGINPDYLTGVPGRRRDREDPPGAQGREHAVRRLPAGRAGHPVPLRDHADEDLK